MASESRLFALSQETSKLIRDFRLKGGKLGTAYIAFAIDKKTHEVRPEEESAVAIEDVEELVDELPDNTPRFVLVSWALTHGDGRQSSPLFVVFWIPRTASTEMSTLYASAKVWFTEKCDVSKVFEIRDADDLTRDYIEEKLKGGR
ncbi:hypothetical protein PYCC9005_006003 [Savitreella phatthalungensis]